MNNMMKQNYTVHPWHGISAGVNAPDAVTAFIEIVPTDTVKYEIDKASGFLKVDRPQKYSNVLPCLYGFIPQTYCGQKIGDYCSKKQDAPEFMEMATRWIFVCLPKKILHMAIL
jgi:inorganic pyrophosphatase